MSPRSQSTGVCHYCHGSYSKAGMARHLAKCRERQSSVSQPPSGSKGGELYHLRVEDSYSNAFWLHLEIPGKTQLVELDDYLRAIWLECCGHLSQFSIGGWSGDEIPMTARVADVFGPDLEVTHIYDFGTSSITSIKAISTREGKFLPSKPIALMARNLQPESSCIECDEPANWFCLECMIEDQVYGTLCDRHVKTHPHEDYEDPIPLVNSPRLGMCGYTGPADPPY